MMTRRPAWPVILLLGVVTLTVFIGTASAETRTAAIGERVSLSGKAVGYDTVYLFMTGPGVPSAGSRMDSSVSPVVTGNSDTFTQVPVDNGYWNYSWNTARVSGGLAEGEYTIYAATEPLSAHDLSGVPYSDLLINLYRPPTTGSLSVLSSPSSAQVSVNGRYAGDTPLNLTSLSPGDYTMEVALQGYLPAKETVTITAGDRKVVEIVLQPLPPETTATTLPVTTLTAATETLPPVPTTRAPFPHLAVVIGILFGAWFCRVRK
jgi:PEGA domain